MTRSERQYIPSARRDPPVVLLENCLEAERWHDVLKWAPSAMAGLVARGLVTLPPGKTLDDLPATVPTVPTDRSWTRKNDFREIAGRILSHLRAGIVTNVHAAATLMQITPATAYKAWARWGPEDWQAAGATLRETPQE